MGIQCTAPQMAETPALVYQKQINEAVRLMEETKTRMADARRIRRDTAQTSERSKVSIRKCEDLVKRAQQDVKRA